MSRKLTARGNIRGREMATNAKARAFRAVRCNSSDPMRATQLEKARIRDEGWRRKHTVLFAIAGCRASGVSFLCVPDTFAWWAALRVRRQETDSTQRRRSMSSKYIPGVVFEVFFERAPDEGPLPTTHLVTNVAVCSVVTDPRCPFQHVRAAAQAPGWG